VRRPFFGASLASAIVLCAAACGNDGDRSGSDAGASHDGGGSTRETGGESSTDGSISGSDGGDTGDGTPGITITSPTDHSTVGVHGVEGGPEEVVTVDFTLTNFTMAAPGSGACSKTSNNCGHIHLFIDPNPDGGLSVCDSPDIPYNAVIASDSPCDAVFSSCPAIDGLHIIILELHHDDHTPVLVGGVTVSASVTVTVTGG
jgi:hypothetical protein